MTSSRRRAVVGLALAVAALLSFPGLLDPGRVFFQRDIGSYWYPQAATFRAVVTSGAWPVWDPYEGFGAAMLADPQSQVLYPPQWLTLGVPPALYYKLFAFTHLLAAGIGAYRWLRRLGASGLAALAGAFVWQVSGPLLSLVSMTQHFTGAAWMPWVLLMVERVLRRRDARSTIALAATAALQSLAGSADLCLMTGLVALGRVAVTGPAAGRHLLRCAGAAALAGALAAAQWIPAAFALAGSSRASMAGLNTYWSLHPAHLVDVLALRLLTDAPVVPPVRAVLFEGREPFLETLYLGPMAVALALVGAFSSRRGAAAALGVALFVLLALGRFGPLAPVFAVVPFSFLRYPVKYMVPAALLAGLLVALAVDRWRVRDAGPAPFARAAASLLGLTLVGIAGCVWVSSNETRVLPFLEGPLPPGGTPASALLWPAVLQASTACGASLLAVLLLLVRARGGHAMPALAVGLCLLAAFGVRGARVANALGPAALLDPPPALASTRGDRILSVSPSAARLNRDLRSTPGWTREELFALGLQQCLGPVTPARWGRRGSYDGDPTLLAPPVVSEAAALVGRYRETPFGVRLIRLGAVTDVVVCDGDVATDAPATASVPTVFPYPARVFHVPDPIPRIRLVSHALEVGSTDEAWHRLGAMAFDPLTDVVLETGRSSVSPASEVEPGALVVRVERADRLEVVVTASGPTALVVADAWSAGWRARVDGIEVPVRRANQLFRGVQVPAGHHVVELFYRPRELLAGLAVSVGAITLVALHLAIRRRGAALKPPIPPL